MAVLGTLKGAREPLDAATVEANVRMGAEVRRLLVPLEGGDSISFVAMLGEQEQSVIVSIVADY